MASVSLTDGEVGDVDEAVMFAPNCTSDDPTTRYVPRPNPIANLGPRWCQHCKIIKPDRTHHCRHCGTCILQFDRMLGPLI